MSGTSVCRELTAADRNTLHTLALGVIDGDPIAALDDKSRAIARDTMQLLDDLGWEQTMDQSAFPLTMSAAALTRLFTWLLDYIEGGLRDDVQSLDDSQNRMSWMYTAFAKRDEGFEAMRRHADASWQEALRDTRRHIQQALAERAVVLRVLGRPDDPPPFLLVADVHDAVRTTIEHWECLGTAVSNAIVDGQGTEDLNTRLVAAADAASRAATATRCAIDRVA